jgi:uncharacterized protein
MTIPKYIVSFFFVVCGLSASCADSNQVDESSQSLPSSGKLLQKEYSKDAEIGNATAQCELGFLYYSGKDGAEQDYEKAREWLTKSADQDYSEAQFLLSAIYSDGLGTNKDSSEGVRLLLKSVEKKKAGKNYNLESNELVVAYSCLGKDFQTGDGVKQDLDKAFSYYFKAAELGDAEAQVLVGSFYSLGISVKEDQKESVKWYERAAKQGDVTGLCALGECYKEGKGVPQNFVEAYKWYNLAVAVGNVSANTPITRETVLPISALNFRDELAKKMTPEQLADAQKRTEMFWSDMKK